MTYQRFLDEAHVYWCGQLAAPHADQVVLAEVGHPDPRVLLRVLTLANAVRRLHPARLVLLAGADGEPPELGPLAAAYAADEIVDIAGRTERRVTALAARAAGGGPPDAAHALTPYVDTGHRRRTRGPLTARRRTAPEYRLAGLRARARAAVYEDVLAVGRPVALVAADTTDDGAGLAVRAARRAHVPVLAVQPRGGLRAYCLFPGHSPPDAPFADALEPLLAEYFAGRVWARRAELAPAAEHTAWRARRGLGRPAGLLPDAVELATAAQRRQVRAHVAARYGLDPARPTVVVGHRPVTEAPTGPAAEVADWYARTAAHARDLPAANWLLLDHPAQDDRTGSVAALAAAHAGADHLRFLPGRALSRNALLALADLGVVLHGRLGPTLAGYGVPVLAAGRGPWTGCGLALPAADVADPGGLLGECVAALRAGRSPLPPDAVARARLWRWLADAGGDVASGLVPPYELWPAEHLLRALTAHLRHVEPDAEPVFAAVERAFTQRLPLLTRVDLPGGPEPARRPAPAAVPHSRADADAPAAPAVAE
ncbi:hypothetical protein GCM10010123_22040 [Pilimelia anulata]|uniref:Uncharacterized protein n=1 Tax=Pilimelia anulata TaxID=53371 RepID=A0A8J3B2V4_9ACTN|nr:hypothetical protein [Pilimelia anulata]GGJ91820.1 hypothetical protein GCM10010123_22040 [Pilimelia anulata]